MVTAADECRGDHSLRIILETLEQLGLPVPWDKLKGPVSCLTFLGFELDSLHNEIRIPGQKMQDIKNEVAKWISKKSCRRKELESLIGRLSHASRVVQPGKTFMRRLFEALAGSQQAHHHIYLSSAVCTDILWWHTFMAEWNGERIIPHSGSPSAVLWTDASGSFGCGAICPTLLKWIQLGWDGLKMSPGEGVDSISWMKLLPVVLACAVWGHCWQG